MNYSTEFNMHSIEFSTELRRRRASTTSNGVVPGTISEVFEDVETCDSKIPLPSDDLSDEKATDKSSGEGGELFVTSNPEEKEAAPEELNPYSKGLIGIPINYFSVGVVYAGSVSILYPILVIQHGVDTSFFTAAVSLVTVFWSYKIIFGILCDCFPIRGQKWRPYIIVGWILCAAMLIVLASMGADVTPTNLVIMLTLANLGYVAADVAADGMMVWVAHQESDNKRGRIQTLIYIIREVGRICINVVVLLGFSGPQANCPGYEADSNVPCTTDESVTSRNDLFESNPDDWCYMTCSQAQFDFGLTIPQYAWIIVAINVLSIPSYIMLKEDKKTPKQLKKVSLRLLGDRQTPSGVAGHAVLNDLQHHIQRFHCCQNSSKFRLAWSYQYSKSNFEHYGIIDFLCWSIPHS